MKKVIITLFFFIILFSCKKDNDLFTYLEVYPLKANLVFPINGSECIEGTLQSASQSEVTFSWEESANTDSYNITVTNLVTKNIQNFTTQNLSIAITIERGVPYSWQVESTSTTATRTAMSSIWNFYNAGPSIQYYIPFPATINSPTNGASVNGNSVNLNWQENDLDNDVIEFDIYFGTTNPPSLFAENLAQSELTNITVSSGTTYYWKVTTRDVIGNESNSEIVSFTVN